MNPWFQLNSFILNEYNVGSGHLLRLNSCAQPVLSPAGTVIQWCKSLDLIFKMLVTNEVSMIITKEFNILNRTSSKVS